MCNPLPPREYPPGLVSRSESLLLKFTPDGVSIITNLYKNTRTVQSRNALKEQELQKKTKSMAAGVGMAGRDRRLEAVEVEHSSIPL